MSYAFDPTRGLIMVPTRITGPDGKDVCRDLPAAIAIDGLLGLDFLRGTRLTIDFRNGTIDVEE